MNSTRAVAAIAVFSAVMGAAPASANETDNFTCRTRFLRDATAAIDALVNASIERAIARANSRRAGCDAGCLIRLLQDEVGRSTLHPLTFVPHAALAGAIRRTPEVDRCHLAFRDTIYGARAYNQPWRYPFLGRLIFVADSIRLGGRLVGLDKVEHFIREGLDQWRVMRRDGVAAAAALQREQGKPGRGLAWTEYGVKGMALTGVFSYADLAAGYAGHQFWTDLLSVGHTGSYVAGRAGAGYVLERRFSFSSYVTDAWDEAINCSTFHPDLRKEVAVALEKRGMRCPVAACHHLAAMPDAPLYVNPACLGLMPPPIERAKS